MSREIPADEILALEEIMEAMAVAGTYVDPLKWPRSRSGAVVGPLSPAPQYPTH